MLQDSNFLEDAHDLLWCLDIKIIIKNAGIIYKRSIGTDTNTIKQNIYKRSTAWMTDPA